MISVVQNGDIYSVHSPYDPVLIDLIKRIPGANWSKATRTWDIYKAQLGIFLKAIEGTRYEYQTTVYSDEAFDHNETVDSTSDIPDIDISDMDVYVQDGSSLYNHQINFLKWAKSRGRRGFILADEMGCGKTLEIINYAMYQRKAYGYKHCLILCCVNVAKFSWLTDIDKHTNGTEAGYIIGTRHRKNGGNKYDGSGQGKLKDLTDGLTYGKEDPLPYFLITNIESLRMKAEKKYGIVDKLIELIRAGEIGMVVIDECHRNMSPTSKQGGNLLEIKKKTGDSAQWISVTGTPITKSPTDLFTPLRLIDAHSIDSYWKWCQYFCVYGGYDNHDIIAYRNIPELKSMTQGNMIRRLKSEVLDLPPKIEYLEFVENTPYQQKLYDQIVAAMVENENGIVTSMNPLARFIKLRQACGFPEYLDPELDVDHYYLSKNSKMSRCIELISEILGRGEKVVVFSQWVSPLKTLYRLIGSNYRVACYTGTMSETDREAHRQSFISDPNVRIMIGTVGALGTSSTLVCANNLIFMDEPWNNSDKTQVEDRINRIGATKQSNIYTILTKDTVDERVHKIMSDKGYMSKYIVDNELDIRNNPKLFKMLLGVV